MEDMFREELWQKQGRPRDFYPDVFSKDVPVPPNLLSVTVDGRHTLFNQDTQTQLGAAGSREPLGGGGWPGVRSGRWRAGWAGADRAGGGECGGGR